MQNFLSLWFNAGAQITHGGQVQRPRQKVTSSSRRVTKAVVPVISSWPIKLLLIKGCSSSVGPICWVRKSLPDCVTLQLSEMRHSKSITQKRHSGPILFDFLSITSGLQNCCSYLGRGIIRRRRKCCAWTTVYNPFTSQLNLRLTHL